MSANAGGPIAPDGGASRGPQGTPAVPPRPQRPPRRPSPLRDRGQWVLVWFTVIGGVITAAVLAGGTWFADKVSGPAELAVHGEAPYSCLKYIDKSPKGFEPPDSETDLIGRPVTAGADDPGTLLITLQGKNSKAIVVTDVEVKVLSSEPAPKSGFLLGGGCGNPMKPRLFNVKFSGSSATTEPAPDDEGKKVNFPLQVSDSDPEYIALRLFPGGRDVRFIVEVKWVSEGEPGGKVLDNNGAGYRIMDASRLPQYVVSRDGMVRVH